MRVVLATVRLLFEVVADLFDVHDAAKRVGRAHIGVLCAQLAQSILRVLLMVLRVVGVRLRPTDGVTNSRLGFEVFYNKINNKQKILVRRPPNMFNNCFS